LVLPGRGGGLGDDLSDPVIACCPDIESFLLFRQSFFTLLTLTNDAAPLSPFAIPTAPSIIESDENRLEFDAERSDMIALCLAGGAERGWENNAILRGASLESDENRPKGSGDRGMIGELP
jgi:hypothetical protein